MKKRQALQYLLTILIMLVLLMPISAFPNNIYSDTKDETLDRNSTGTTTTSLYGDGSWDSANGEYISTRATSDKMNFPFDSSYDYRDARLRASPTHYIGNRVIKTGGPYVSNSATLDISNTNVNPSSEAYISNLQIDSLSQISYKTKGTNADVEYIKSTSDTEDYNLRHEYYLRNDNLRERAVRAHSDVEGWDFLCNTCAHAKAGLLMGVEPGGAIDLNINALTKMHLDIYFENYDNGGDQIMYGDWDSGWLRVSLGVDDSWTQIWHKENIEDLHSTNLQGNHLDINNIDLSSISVSDITDYSFDEWGSREGMSNNPLFTIKVEGRATACCRGSHADISFDLSEVMLSLEAEANSLSHFREAYIYRGGHEYWIPNSNDHFSGWDNRISSSSSLEFRSDYYNNYDFYKYQVDSISADVYYPETALKCDIEYYSTKMGDESGFWYHKFNDLDGSSHFTNEGGGKGSLALDFNPKYATYPGSFSYKDGIILSYGMDYGESNWNTDWEQYGFKITRNINLVDGDGNGEGSWDYGVADFHRDITMDFKKIELAPQYITELEYESAPILSINRAFNGWTTNGEGEDTPQYTTTTTDFSRTIAEGSGSDSFIIEWTTDTTPPSVSDYYSTNTMYDTNTEEVFSATCSDDDIEYAKFIAEAESTHTFDLTQNGDQWNWDYYYGSLMPNNYTCWYAFQDIAGNYYTTPSFQMELKATKVSITNLEIDNIPIDDYEGYDGVSDPTGHELTFTLGHSHPDNYSVYVDGSVLHNEQSFYNGESISVGIHNYDVGNHSILIEASDDNGVTNTKSSSFYVYEAPTISEPQDETYVTIHGNFTLEWNVNDNSVGEKSGLSNYEIYIDGSSIVDSDSLSGSSDTISYTGDTSELSVGTHTYEAIAYDNEGQQVSDSVSVSIVQYETPVITIDSPDTYTQSEENLTISAQIDHQNEISIESVMWGLTFSGQPSTWHSMTDENNDDTWEATNLDPLDYRQGEYILYVKATTDVGDTINTTQNLELDPRITYGDEQGELSIEYLDSDICVSEDQTESSSIWGIVNFSHNSVVKEELFTVILPEQFSDAFDYYLYRGQNKYTPSGVSETIREWGTRNAGIPYKENETIYFSLNNPEITNDDATVGGGDEIYKTFTITSEYNFTNSVIHNTFQTNEFDFSHKNYYYTLEYNEEGSWISINNFDLQFGDYPEYEFNWNIEKTPEGADPTEFRMSAYPKVRIENVVCNDVEYGTEGNTLDFDLFGGESITGNNTYKVYVNNTLEDDGSWSNSDPISVDIDNYANDYGTYNVSIYANDTLGTEDTWEGSFRVITTPRLTETPEDASYVDIHGDFTLEWMVENNGLENYTIYRNGDTIVNESFDNPYSATISITNNTSELGIGSYNYTLVVKDNESLSTSDETFIDVVAYQHPITTIENPIDSATITDISNQTIKVNVSSISEVPIENVYYDLNSTNRAREWKHLSYNEFTSYWKAKFSPMDYRSGTYDLIVKVENPYANTTEQISGTLKPLVPYYFSEVDYTSDITVSYNDADTTSIEGSVLVEHNDLVRDTYFEVYLPQGFSDAFDYDKIYRNTTEYKPENYGFEHSAYTIWDTSWNYQSSDTIGFQLVKPTLTNIDKQTDAYGNIDQRSILYSGHSFTDINIINRIDGIDYPNEYLYNVSYLSGGNWIHISEDNYTLTTDSENNYAEFNLNWDSIDADQSIRFRYEAFPQKEQVEISDLTLPDYEYNSTGNTLNFTLSHDFPDSYTVSVDNETIDSTTWDSPQEVSLNIDEYDIGVHNVKIYATSTFGISLNKTYTFRVFQTPEISTPSNRSYADSHNNFTLYWEIWDNGLEDYQILLNDTVIDEGNFTNPNYAELSITNNTLKLGNGLHTYTLKVNDNDTLNIVKTTEVSIVPYEAPSINITSHTDGQIITDDQPNSVNINIDAISQLSIENALWDLRSPTEAIEWKNLTEIYSTEWKTQFDPTEFEYGEYEMWIQVEDQYYTTNTSITLNLELFLTYELDRSDVSYQTEDIIVSTKGSETIKASADITHDSTIKERDFEVYLPSAFSDARNYQIYRGTSTINPENTIDYPTKHTIWDMSDYKSEDTMYFDILKPQISTDYQFEDLEGTNEEVMDFEITSKRSFTNVSVKIYHENYRPNIGDFNAHIEYLYEGNWTQIPNDSTMEGNKGFPIFSFKMDEVSSGSTQFRVVLTPKPPKEPFPWAGTMYGLMGGFVMGLIIALGYVGWQDNKGNFSYKSKKGILIAILITAGITALGTGIGVGLGFLGVL